MNFTLLDWTAIAAYLGITLLLGLYFRSRSGKSVDEYFVSGRDVSWWLAGTSMVATTFAADTPLVVTGLVYRQGVGGNWLWWSMLLSGMMTVFLFARLWRRSGVITDVEFAEIRYAGKPAAFLRGFRAIYLGLLMNCLILGWVTRAMVSIVGTTMGVSERSALAITVLFIVPFTGLYVSLGGLWGVLWTDLFQFCLKMGIVIALAFYAVRAIGGMDVMIARLSAMSAAGGAQASNPLRVLPDFSRGLTAEPLWAYPVITFLVNLGLQWWAFWYPGAEPGGGGYIAQRIFSAKDERNGLLSVLWFNVAHYALRPWPWIITALAVIVLYPNLAQPESGYILMLNQHLPHAWRGVAIAGFLAAFMSTVATQLNWGASYLVADFYRRFLKKNASEQHYVNASRLATVLLVIASAWVSLQLASIGSGWQIVLQIGAGTGAVYILRWYWWRINAWSEISAMATSLLVTTVLNWSGLWMRVMGRGSPFSGASSVLFAKTALTTTVVATVVWVAVTLVTRPEHEEVLDRFYRKVRPDVRGWRPVAARVQDVAPNRDLGRNLIAWVLGCGMIYCALLGTGKLLLGQTSVGLMLAVGAVVCAVLLYLDQTARAWGAESELAGGARKLAKV
ncbi:MAG TPA: sodium:solute symporter family protein [Terriglobales bacterium]|nr:sodium:solute symporter family protein [Terriglobales bacterium]